MFVVAFCGKSAEWIVGDVVFAMLLASVALCVRFRLVCELIVRGRLCAKFAILVTDARMECCCETVICANMSFGSGSNLNGMPCNC